jgi:hypothetical protein
MRPRKPNSGSLKGTNARFAVMWQTAHLQISSKVAEVQGFGRVTAHGNPYRQSVLRGLFMDWLPYILLALTRPTSSALISLS